MNSGLLLAFALLQPAPTAPAYAPVADEALADRTVRAVFKISSLPLQAIPSCRGVGLSADARTIGDFFGGALAQFANRAAKQPILLVSAARAARRSAWVPVQVTLHRAEGEEEWNWGLQFQVTARGAIAVRNIRCVVAG